MEDTIDNLDTGIRLDPKEIRANKKANTTNFLAIIFFGCFLLMVFMDMLSKEIETPTYLISIASIILGFYFKGEINKE